MKRLCLILSMLLLTVHLCFAPVKTETGIMMIQYPKAIVDVGLVKRQYNILFAIVRIEKPKNREQAIASFKREGAIGVLQIHKEVVDDVNNLILKRKVYTHSDCNDSIKSVEIFKLYQGYWNPTFNLYKAAMLHNGGPTWYKANAIQKKRLLNYWYKVKKNLPKNT